jgi:hypothetical protein
MKAAVRKTAAGPTEKLDEASPEFSYTEPLRLALSEGRESKGEVAERLKAAVC